MRIMFVFIAMVVASLTWGSERTASYVNDEGDLYILHNGKCVHKYYTVPGFHDAYKMGQRLNRTYCWRYNGRGEFLITNFAGDQMKGDVEELVYEDIEGFDDEAIVFPTKRDRSPPTDPAEVPTIQPAPPPPAGTTVTPIVPQPQPTSQPHDPSFDAKVNSGHDAQTEWVDADGKTHYRFVLH